jgi:signal transduction histidine kinase
LIALFAGVFVTSAGAWWVAGRLACLTLNPLTNLVDQIRAVDPLSPAQQPVARTGDADIDAIPEAVNALVRELDHVLRRERAFADAASHELRTPLAVIRGGVDVLRERGETPGPIVDRLERAVRRAQDDLEALLALSPAREPAPPTEIDLREFLPRAAEPYVLGRTARTRVVWTWNAAAIARVEPAALAIVFSNLVRNAVQAAPNGEVRIEVDPSFIRVVDDGEGLPASGVTTEAKRGRGVGLLIAHALAERHGWALSLSAAAPRGTQALLVLVPDGGP